MRDSNRPVSLGCGTLILIALIVLIFSNASDDGKKQLRQLRSEVQALTKEVRDLRESIEDREAVRGVAEASDVEPEK